MKMRILLHGGGVYDKRTVENIFFPEDISVGEDTIWISKILKNATRICSLHERLYYYTILHNSALHSKFSEKRYGEILAWRRICELYNYKQNSVIAYAVRIQEFSQIYNNDEFFSVEYARELFICYARCVKALLLYWIYNKKFFSAIKVFLWVFVLGSNFYRKKLRSKWLSPL